MSKNLESLHNLILLLLKAKLIPRNLQSYPRYSFIIGSNSKSIVGILPFSVTREIKASYTEVPKLCIKPSLVYLFYFVNCLLSLGLLVPINSYKDSDLIKHISTYLFADLLYFSSEWRFLYLLAEINVFEN